MFQFSFQDLKNRVSLAYILAQKKRVFRYSGKSGTIHFSNFPYRHKKLQTSAFTALGLQILSFIRHGNYLNRQDSPTFTTGTATSSDVLSP